MDNKDRRESPRVSFYCEALFEGIDVANTNVRLADLSVGGAFIDTRTVLPAGAKGHLRFVLGEHEVKVTAEVRYSMTGIGMGVRFLDLSSADRERIVSFVASQA
jgi:c-di-GMP-binding flagellar brake protein YcgR